MPRSIELPTNSRLSRTPLEQVPGRNEYHWGVWSKIVFEVSTGDRRHVVRSKDILRWDLLAQQFYKDYSKMWVIWSANGIQDPFAVEVGTVLRIPDPVVVNAVLASLEGVGE